MIQDNASRLHKLISKVIDLLEVGLNQETGDLKIPRDVTNIVYKVLTVLIQLNKFDIRHSDHDISEQDREIIEQFLKEHKND